MAATKIMTCCYCGTQAALELRGKKRHELACSNCGAPLHVMKSLPQTPDRVTAPAATPTRPAKPRERSYANKPGKRRKSRGFGKKVWEEVWDTLEDIFD
jgi:hypothetical protein